VSSDGHCLKFFKEPLKKSKIKKEKKEVKEKVIIKVQCNQCYKLMRKDKLRLHLTKTHKIDVPKGKNEVD